jgi:hypothetical protein
MHHTSAPNDALFAMSLFVSIPSVDNPSIIRSTRFALNSDVKASVYRHINHFYNQS